MEELRTLVVGTPTCFAKRGMPPAPSELERDGRQVRFRPGGGPQHRLEIRCGDARSRFSALLLATVLVLAAIVPLFGLPLLLVVATDRTASRGLVGARRWPELRPR